MTNQAVLTPHQLLLANASFRPFAYNSLPQTHEQQVAHRAGFPALYKLSRDSSAVETGKSPPAINNLGELLARLPSEVVSRIMYHLDPKSAAEFARVSRVAHSYMLIAYGNLLFHNGQVGAAGRSMIRRSQAHTLEGFFNEERQHANFRRDDGEVNLRHNIEDITYAPNLVRHFVGRVRPMRLHFGSLRPMGLHFSWMNGPQLLNELCSYVREFHTLTKAHTNNRIIRGIARADRPRFRDQMNEIAQAVNRAFVECSENDPSTCELITRAMQVSLVPSKASFYEVVRAQRPWSQSCFYGLNSTHITIGSIRVGEEIRAMAPFVALSLSLRAYIGTDYTHCDMPPIGARHVDLPGDNPLTREEYVYNQLFDMIGALAAISHEARVPFSLELVHHRGALDHIPSEIKQAWLAAIYRMVEESQQAYLPGDRWLMCHEELSQMPVEAERTNIHEIKRALARQWRVHHYLLSSSLEDAREIGLQLIPDNEVLREQMPGNDKPLATHLSKLYARARRAPRETSRQEVLTGYISWLFNQVMSYMPRWVVNRL